MSTDKRRRKKPPCFGCGRHLYQNHSRILYSKMDGIARSFHKSCAEEEIKNNPEHWSEISVPNTKLNQS